MKISIKYADVISIFYEQSINRFFYKSLRRSEHNNISAARKHSVNVNCSECDHKRRIKAISKPFRDFFFKKNHCQSKRYRKKQRMIIKCRFKIKSQRAEPGSRHPAARTGYSGQPFYWTGNAGHVQSPIKGCDSYNCRK